MNHNISPKQSLLRAVFVNRDWLSEPEIGINPGQFATDNTEKTWKVVSLDIPHRRSDEPPPLPQRDSLFRERPLFRVIFRATHLKNVRTLRQFSRVISLAWIDPLDLSTDSADWHRFGGAVQRLSGLLKSVDICAICGQSLCIGLGIPLGLRLCRAGYSVAKSPVDSAGRIQNSG